LKKICFTAVIFFSLLFSNSLFAGNGKISGVVFSGSYQNAVQGVVVNLVGTGKGNITDSTGQYQIADLQDGEYTIRFMGIGYKTIERKISIKNGTSLHYSMNLEEELSSMQEVVIKPKINYRTIFGYNAISQLDINLRPTNSAQDLLKLVPGLFIAQHAGGGKAEQIFIRGFDCDHGTDFASYVDGIPVNMVSHAHGQGYSDLHFVIPETIEEMDVYKGSYYAKFGDLETTGAADFKTYNILNQNEIKLEYGQFDTYRVMAMINLLNDKTHLFSKLKENLYVAGEYRFTNGYFTSPEDFSKFNGLIKYYGQLTDKTTMTFSASAFTSKWNASGQIPVRAVTEGIIGPYGSLDPSEGGQTNRENVNLFFDHYYDADHHIRNQFYYSHYDFNLYSDFTYFLVDTVHGDEINQKDKRDLFGYNGSYDLNSKLFGFNSSTTFGAGFRYDNAHISLIHDEKRVALDTFVDGRLNQLNTFAYVDENIFITPKFRINPGLRFDFFNFNFQNNTHPDSSGDMTKALVSPKLNFIYDVAPDLQLYLKGGYGFHSNDSRAIIINHVDNINDNIVPRSIGSDLGTFFKPAPNTIINFALWINYMQNELVYNGDDGTVTPIGATLRRGADLSIRYEFYRHFYFDADVNYSYGRRLHVPSDSVYIPLAPILTSIAGITYKAPSGINGGLRYRYLSDRPANEAWSRTATGYFLMDASLNYTRKQWEIGVSVENIFNIYWKEAEFDTESRLKGEEVPVTQIDYTPGTPRIIKGHMTLFF